MPKQSPQDFVAIRAQLKACDKERYLSALFVGGVDTQSLWTLYAFGCELAKISSIVQEPMLGKMRLQWWRDVIEQAYDQPQVLSGHPVADQLSMMMVHYNLKTAFFLQIIDARERDLEAQFFTGQQDFDDYHDAIWGNLYRLSYLIMGKGGKSETEKSAIKDPVFRIAGCVTAMIKFLSYGDRAALKSHMVMSLGQEKLSFNLEEMAENKDFQAYKSRQIRHILEQLDEISDRLIVLSEFDERVFLPLVLVPEYLNLWEKEGQAVTMPQNINPLKQFWLLWRGSQKGIGSIFKNRR